MGSNDELMIRMTTSCILNAKVHVSNEHRSSYLIDSVLRGYLEVIGQVIVEVQKELGKNREAVETHSAFTTQVMELIENEKVIQFVIDECLF